MGIVVDPSLLKNCGVGILLKNLATLFEIISRSGQVGQCNGSNIEYVDRVKVVNVTGQIFKCVDYVKINHLVNFMFQLSVS